MKVFCLGGAGAITREAIRDLLDHLDVETVVIGDCDEQMGKEVVAWLDNPRVSFRKVSVEEGGLLAKLMSDFDLVMDGTPISVNSHSTALIAQARVHGINLNGMSDEWNHDQTFKTNKKTFVPGFGMTPGVTNLMALHAANQMDTVAEVFISHGSFRPIAFSRAIAETTVLEYDPELPSRIVFQDGKFRQLPPFCRPKLIKLPDPFGEQVQYIIPHPETLTLAKSLEHKSVKLIEVRGTWPPQNMALLRALYDFGILRNPVVEVDGVEVGVLDAVVAHLLQSPEGTTTSLYGYALHVEVKGTKDGNTVSRVLTTTHPPSDGSVAEWKGLRAYTRSVAIPFSVGAQMILEGKARAIGTVAPEQAFDPSEVFEQLGKRGVLIHEERAGNEEALSVVFPVSKDSNLC
jgi:saccharopine dehydrogenase-like NADP-dependent oxidoreductase